MKLKNLVFILALFIAFTTGCAKQQIIQQTQPAPVKSQKNTDTLFQVSTLQALMQGYYYPVSTVKELKANGDFGIGCFERVNGELIMLDGVVYQAIYNSSILTPQDDYTVPYATVAFFHNDINVTFNKIKSIDTLKKQLDKIVNKTGKNMFYLVRIDGVFEDVTYRSEYAQKEPYKPLAKAMETDQKVFNKKNELGIIVGLFCPSFMDKLNTPGWHFHYITSDRKTGGHLIYLSSKKLAVQLSKKSNFKMILPEETKFQNLPLSKDMGKDIGKVETGKGKK